MESSTTSSYHDSVLDSIEVKDTSGESDKSLHHVNSQYAADFWEADAVIGDGRRKKKKGKGLAKNKETEYYKKEIEMTEHLMTIDELVQKLDTDIKKGLSTEECQKRLQENGPNSLPSPKEVSLFIVFLQNLFEGFQILLWIASILCFISYGLSPELALENAYIGGVLIVVLLVSGIFTFYQEYKSKKIMKGFTKLVPQYATVVRSGQIMNIPSEELVVGDIIRVKGGDKISADIRLVEVDGLKVDNSSMTGESEPQSRSIKCTNDNPLETKNVAFFTTSALEGTATGIVINTGANTVIGRIAGLTMNTKVPPSTLKNEINFFIKIISSVAIFFGIVFLILGFIKFGVGSVDSVVKTIVFAIGIVVANVPEGLLATVTVTLTLTAKRMATKHVLVKNLESIETLGSISTICTDKTGTLTQNRMTVTHLWYNKKTYVADPHGKDSDYDTKLNSFNDLFNIASLCNRAVYDPDDDSPVAERKTIGDASESALLKFCDQIKDVEEHRALHPQAAQIPFNSTNKWALTINQNYKNYVIYLKGAPDRLLKMCSSIKLEDKVEKLDNKWKRKIENAVENLGEMGERVLGFAMLELDPKDYPIGFKFDTTNINFPLKDFKFIGLISLMDPPRLGVPEAVAECQSASIKVIMVTGDHPVTAKAIAKQVGIIKDETIEDIAKRSNMDVADVDPAQAKAVVISGTTLKDMSEDELDDVIKNYDQIVFARTSPQQKLIIVESCQRCGNVVAVTGDGVNDSPALKKADIGIAMGIAGSDVAKEAAKMILLDDNFASIVKGIEEGRLIFDNLKKSISYTLSSNIPEMIPFLLYVLIELPLPLSTVLILCIDVGTDMWPAISLAYEKGENNLMKRKPRKVKTERLVSAKLISFAYLQIGIFQALAGLFVYLVVMGDGKDYNGFPPVSLPGLASEFLTRVNVTDYNICRVVTVPGEQHLVGCLPTIEELNNITDAMYFSGGNWTSGILENMFVDYCFNDQHRELFWSCQESNVFTRSELLRSAQSSFFVTIVVVQWADLLICKTRSYSLFQQGMRNWALNFGLLFETVLACIIVYVPFLQIPLGTHIVYGYWWLAPLPFFFMIILYDETRKFFIRRYPDGWIAKHTYY